MLVLAHRGANRRAPENSEAAFVAARELGADGVELDVRRTADGALVVHHDAGTALGPVAACSLARLRRALPALLTLEEALDTCAGLLVNVELKSPRLDPGGDPGERGPGEAVAVLLARRGGRDDVVVSSFDPAEIDVVRAHDRALRTALLTFDPLGALGLAAAAGYAMVNPALAALAAVGLAAVVEAAAAAGVGVMAWTVNDAADVSRLADAGVDAVISDVPEVVLEVVRARPA